MSTNFKMISDVDRTVLEVVYDAQDARVISVNLNSVPIEEIRWLVDKLNTYIDEKSSKV